MKREMAAASQRMKARMEAVKLEGEMRFKKSKTTN